jgi:chromosome segregation ATPase
MNNMQPDFNTLSYRLDGIEKQIVVLQNQLQHYVPVRENELQLRNIQDSVRDVKTDMAEIRKTINDMAQKMIDQENAARERDNAQRESQDKLQIRVLYGAISVIITIMVGVIIFWITHVIQ